MTDYRSFLEAKVCLAQSHGFDVDPRRVNPQMKPHAQAIVPWAIAGGRRAIFASFGLQKTSMQIDILRIIGAEKGGPVLCVLPLGVRQEFSRDAGLYFKGEYGVELRFIRHTEEIEDRPGVIHLTNYESVRADDGSALCAEAWPARPRGGAKPRILPGRGAIPRSGRARNVHPNPVRSSGRGGGSVSKTVGARKYEPELLAAARRMRIEDGLTWRAVGRILKRDGSGLCRACDNAEPNKPISYRRKRRVRSIIEARPDLPMRSPLHQNNRPLGAA